MPENNEGKRLAAKEEAGNTLPSTPIAAISQRSIKFTHRFCGRGES
jgi:hypothetical protein